MKLMILIKIFEESELNIVIKTKIIFEFIILLKNSENIFNEKGMIIEETNQFCDKEFFGYINIENVGSNDWQVISNNIISDEEEQENNKMIINDIEEDEKEKEIKNLNIIEDNENEFIDITVIF